MANQMLESFGESPKACVTNSSSPPEKLKGKETPDLPVNSVQKACIKCFAIHTLKFEKAKQQNIESLVFSPFDTRFLN